MRTQTYKKSEPELVNFAGKTIYSYKSYVQV